MKIQPIDFYNTWAQRFTEEQWGIELNIPVVVARRNAKSAGCFWYNRRRNEPVRITLSYHIITSHDHMIDTLKHELCHWYCFINKLDHNDGSKDFERMLQSVGATSTHFGYNNHEKSAFLQQSILDDIITRNGHQDITYRKITSDEAVKLMNVHDHPMLSYLRFKLYGSDAIHSAYEVYVGDLYCGTIFKYNNRWCTAQPIEKHVLNTGWKTRKALALELAWQKANHIITTVAN